MSGNIAEIPVKPATSIIPANGGGNSRGTAADRPKAPAWMNIGYATTDPKTGEELFISLPVGIPLDPSVLEKEASSPLRRSQMSMFRKAYEAAMQLEPGAETVVVDDSSVSGLQIRIRRVRDTATDDEAGELFAGMPSFSAVG